METMEGQRGQPPSMEEVRKRRLAYFQSTSKENILENKPAETFQERPQTNAQKQRPQKEFRDESSHMISERIQKGHEHSKSQFVNVPTRSGGLSQPKTETKKRPPTSKSSEDILSKEWNSHVEHLFKKEKERSKGDKSLGRKDSHELLRESQDLDAVSMFKSEADYEDLGLSTHRPESDRASFLQNSNNSNSGSYLEESLSQEMRNLLGEDKYQEFVDKSVKDINELYHHKTTETSPHLIKSLIEDQSKRDGDTKSGGDNSNRQMNNTANSRSPRHRLHRPKHEPIHIQNLVTKTKRDLEMEGSEVAPSTGKNYEQVTVNRNVTFSADEIYRQAFGAPPPPFQQVMMPASSMAYNQGLAASYNQVPSSNYSQAPYNQGPPVYNQGMPFHPMMMNMPQPQGGFQSPHGQYFPPDFSQPPPGHFMYPQPDMYTPRTPTTPTGNPVYYPQDPNFSRFQGYNMYQSQPFSPTYPQQYQNYPPPPPPPMHIPHPPPQPPSNMQHPPAQGMFYPYQQNVPMMPHPPEEKKEETHSAELHAHNYHAGNEKAQRGTDSHEPHNKGDNCREDGQADRHIEAIRIHHEQRRQMQEEKMNEVIHMEKQKKFAKASLDRYFSSLENIYRGPPSNQSSLPQTEEESEETPEESDESGPAPPPDDVLTSVTATSVKAGGITQRLEGLGIDVTQVKPKDTSEIEEANDGTTKKKKKVKVCPSCNSWNKDYMSWCAECSEILIGVEAVVAKRKDKRKGKTEGLEKERNEVIERKNKMERPVTPNTKRSTSISQDILSYRNDQNMKVSITKPEVEGYLKQLEKAKKDLAVPTVGSSAQSSFKRSPQEINDLCQVINDPVIRGFIKNYFSRKSAPQSEPVEESSPVESEKVTPKAETENDLSEGEIILNLAASADMSAPKNTEKNQEMGDIDVEIFAIEESRQSRPPSCTIPVVPSLDLHDSSDDEEVIARRRQAMLTQPVSFSLDTDDYSSVNESQQFNPEEVNEEFPVDSGMSPPNPSFLSHILAMRSGRTNDVRDRPASAGKSKGIVRESIEAEPYQRHWEKSSIAWASYHPRELNTRSSLQNAMLRDSRVRGSGSMDNLSASRRVDGRNQVAAQKKPRPASADLYKKKLRASSRPASAQVRPSKHLTPGGGGEGETSPTTLSPSQPNIIPHRLPPDHSQSSAPHALQGPASALTAYNMYMEMTPRIEEGEFSKWQCLPDEIWLYIFSFLPHRDLAAVSRTCKQFCRIAVDDSLWKFITVKKLNGICDEWLNQIANRHPVSLALIQCHGDNVTAKGLRELFRECADCLRELNFSRCSRGGLTGDSILLHASARCRNLTHVDASWCHVTDNGLVALSESAHRLESLCLNGCQMLSDDGIENVIKKHGSSLRVLEMFGCFNMTPRSIRCVAEHCTNLNTINLGQCFRLTDSCITHLSASLGRIEHLDLRGCKQIKDGCIRKIVRNCPRLKTITIANCPHISDAALIEIATYANDIRSIDICGCRHVTDHSIRTLANNCQRLTQLDISSSGCSHRSVLLLANYCNRNLEVLKLNFLADVTEGSLQKLVKHCKKLKTLHLYGCTSVRSVEKLKLICPFLHVEM